MAHAIRADYTKDKGKCKTSVQAGDKGVLTRKRSERGGEQRTKGPDGICLSGKPLRVDLTAAGEE